MLLDVIFYFECDFKFLIVDSGNKFYIPKLIPFFLTGFREPIKLLGSFAYFEDNFVSFCVTFVLTEMLVTGNILLNTLLVTWNLWIAVIILNKFQ